MVFEKLGFKNNTYEIDGDITHIYITNQKGQQFDVLIDTEDLQRLINLDQSWHIKWEPISQNYYVRSSYYEYNDKLGKKKLFNLYLHSFIINAEQGETVDHIDHNTLDNRKINLRRTEKKKNLQHRKGANSNSTTGVRNVHLITGYKDKQYYKVQIMKDGIHHVWDFALNEFKEACKFAEQKRKELFGEFAGNS